MKRTFLILEAIVTLSIASYAQEKLSVYSRLVENNYKQSIAQDTYSSRILKNLSPLNIDGNGETNVEVMIELVDGAELPVEVVENLEMKSISTIGNIHILKVPIENLSSIAELEEVKCVSISRRVKLLNDKARSATKVTDVHNGIDLPQSYTGKDIVVGVVDVGIDFNHINFKDENNKSRIKVAGSYDSKSGTSKIYNTDETIAKLTTDYINESHGTHVSGIAAGSYKTNDYHGMATGSDLVLYGLGYDMSDANILKGVKAVFDYADLVNKPAVVNLSLGINTGPHDGSDPFNKAIDELSDEGKIVVVASGNEGSDRLYINHTFTSSSTSTPQYSTVVSSWDSPTYDCEIDTWSSGKDPIGIQFFIYNSSTNQEMLTSSVFYPTTTSYKTFNWNSSSLATYFKGTIQVIGQLNASNNKYQMYTYITGSSTNSKYYIGVKMYGKENTEVHSWTSGAEFIKSKNENYVQGTSDGSYNDMCCGKEVISIGAYCAKDRVKTYNGASYSYNGVKLNDIAYFSSYGTDLNGINHPDVVAPGFMVVSSVNNYDNVTTVTEKAYLANIVSPFNDTRKYHWPRQNSFFVFICNIYYGFHQF